MTAKWITKKNVSEVMDGLVDTMVQIELNQFEESASIIILLGIPALPSTLIMTVL